MKRKLKKNDPMKWYIILLADEADLAIYSELEVKAVRPDHLLLIDGNEVQFTSDPVIVRNTRAKDIDYRVKRS